LGYQLLVRLSLAAVASLGQSAGALAGTIEGAVAFPSPLVPSMLVYASELDTARIHTVQLARGQTNFSVEVPAGRYLVFLAPNEPGAPNIYGAYTRYSVCAAHQAGNCDDHALLPVSIGAKASRSTVTIDDWYLSDDTAEQIDRIRGVAAGGKGVLDSEPLSAPRFSEYPSAVFDAADAPQADFGGNELSREEREILQTALAGGPNFAGHVTATLTGCGPACSRLVLIDWHTGAVQGIPPQTPLIEIQGTLPCRREEALLFRRDSRLLYVTHLRGNAVVTQYFVWNQKNGALVQSGEFQRPAQSFCAIAAR
jgi:hypothetical protein